MTWRECVRAADPEGNAARTAEAAGMSGPMSQQEV